MTISVIIDNFNYAEFLGEAIESALHQTLPAHEIIVVEDGSTDASREVLLKYEGRVKIVLLEDQGQLAALVSGLRASTGEAICFLDSDDIWFPDKLASVAAIFEKHHEVEWIRHKLQVCDEQGRKLKPIVPRFKGSRQMRLSEFEGYERIAPVSTSALSIRRTLAARIFQRLLSDVHGADSHLAEFRHAGDAYILASMSRAGVVGYSLDAILGHYRRHCKQQFTSSLDLIRLIGSEIEVGEKLQRCCHPSYRSTHVSKHALMAMHLEGKPRFGRERRRAFQDGLVRAVNLGRQGSVKLAALQVAKLTFAFVAPATWVRKLLRQSPYGLAPPSGIAGQTLFKRPSRVRSS